MNTVLRAKKSPRVRAFEKVQVLSSRGPPVRAVAIADNLYKSHAYLRGEF